MNYQNNQVPQPPSCPPRLASHEKSKEHNYHSINNNAILQNRRIANNRNNQNVNGNRYSLVVGQNGQYVQQGNNYQQTQQNRQSLLMNQYPQTNIQGSQYNQQSYYTSNSNVSPQNPQRDNNPISNQQQNKNQVVPSSNNTNRLYPNSRNSIYANNGDLSSQIIPENKYLNMNNNVNNNNNNGISKSSSDFDFNITQKKNDNDKKHGDFFDIIPNLKNMIIQSQVSRWAIILTIIQFLSVVTLEVLIFISFRVNYSMVTKNEEHFENDEEYQSQSNQMKAVLIYQILFTLSQIYVMVLFYDSLRVSNSIQLVAISVFNFLTACYSLIQYNQTFKLMKYFTNEINKGYFIMKDVDKIKYLEIVIVIVLFFSSIILGILSYFLLRKFGWNIYRNVGADIQKTKILKRKYTFWLLFKFNIFFLVGIIVQGLIFNDEEDQNMLYKILIPVLSVCLILHIYIGYKAISRERKDLMILFITTMVLFIVYEVYILYYMFAEDKFKATKNFLSGFTIVELILLLISIYYSIAVMINFNVGDIEIQNFEKDTEKIRRRISL